MVADTIFDHRELGLFQPNSFEEVCFLEESYENMQKFQILQGGGAGHDCLNLNFRQNFP